MDNARLEFQDLDPCLSVRAFQVREQLNQPFVVELSAVAPDESLDLEALVGCPATFVLAGTTERRWRGLVRRAQLEATAEDGTGLATFSLTLVPTLWRLSQRRRQRAFQHLSIPTIVEQILSSWKI
ncbi:MAG: hypothetical protein JRI23_35010, partial [Deltaproteobacteria bacterium]|nr:hypothetical protein [Deltaproteobacteria bacterium]MBW2537518.1 hypothetical protein [Deltaproteobacteria bacterium]